MPRGFTEREREAIRESLMGAGQRLFVRYGLKKTTIDEIVREAGIAKGSFYLFFESKESLFMDVFERTERELRATLTEEVFESDLPPKEQFRKIFGYLFKIFQINPMVRIIINKEEIEHLMRSLPPGRFRSHVLGDEAFIADLLRRWQSRGIFINRDPELLAGMFRAFFFLNLHRDEIGPEVFPKITDLIVDLIADSCFVDEGETKGGHHD